MAEKRNIAEEKETVYEMKKSITREVIDALRESSVTLGTGNGVSRYRNSRRLRRECEAIFRR
jgi:hypothetical protein